MHLFEFKPTVIKGVFSAKSSYQLMFISSFVCNYNSALFGGRSFGVYYAILVTNCLKRNVAVVFLMMTLVIVLPFFDEAEWNIVECCRTNVAAGRACMSLIAGPCRPCPDCWALRDPSTTVL